MYLNSSHMEEKDHLIASFIKINKDVMDFKLKANQELNSNVLNAYY